MSGVLTDKVIEKFLRKNSVAMMEAIKYSGMKPLEFYQYVDTFLERMEKGNFGSQYEKNVFAEDRRLVLESVLKTMKMFINLDSMIYLHMLIDAAASNRNIYLLLQVFHTILTELYAKNSQHWQYTLGFIKPSSNIFITSFPLEFVDLATKKKPTIKQCSDYIRGLLDFDIISIKAFENYFVPMGMEETQNKNYLFLHTFDIERAWEKGSVVTLDDEYWEIDLSYPRRIGVIGGSGTGKTKCSELLMSFYCSTHKIINLNDHNAEMIYCKFPSSQKALLEEYGKRPRGLPVETFSLPPFQQEAIGDENKRIDKIIRLNPFLMKPPDWDALLNLNPMQQIAFSNLLKDLAGNFDTVTDILNKLIVSTKIHATMKRTLSIRLENLISQDIFGDRNNKDTESILLSKKISSFDTSLIFDEALLRGTISFFLRQIADYAKRGKSKLPFCVVMEEFQSLLQEGLTKNKFNANLNELLRRLRVSNVSVILVQQNITDLPDWAIANIPTWVILRIRSPSQLNKLKETYGYNLQYITDIVPTLPNDHAIFIDSLDVVGGRIIPPPCRHKIPKIRMPPVRFQSTVK